MNTFKQMLLILPLLLLNSLGMAEDSTATDKIYFDSKEIESSNIEINKEVEIGNMKKYKGFRQILIGGVGVAIGSYILYTSTIGFRNNSLERAIASSLIIGAGVSLSAFGAYNYFSGKRIIQKNITLLISRNKIIVAYEF